MKGKSNHNATNTLKNVLKLCVRDIGTFVPVEMTADNTCRPGSRNLCYQTHLLAYSFGDLAGDSQCNYCALQMLNRAFPLQTKKKKNISTVSNWCTEKVFISG